VLVEGLVKQHQEREEHLQEETRSLKKELGDLKQTIQAWRQDQVADERTKKQEQKAFQAAVQDEHQKQGAAMQEVQALLKEKSKTPSYSEVVKTPAAQPEQPWTTVERRKAA
jgi:predicted  nucleic acid-binding Zn-ribbon protein